MDERSGEAGGRRFFQKHPGSTAYVAVSDWEFNARMAEGYREVLVIGLDELPVVDPERPGFSGYVGLDGPGSAITEPEGLLATPKMHRERALRELALAAYLERYPWGPDWTRPNTPATEATR